MKYITGIYIYICLVLGSMVNSIVNLYPKNKIMIMRNYSVSPEKLGTVDENPNAVTTFEDIVNM